MVINFTGRKIPVTRITDIRLFQRASIHKEFSITEFDSLTLQTHDPFQKHHLTAGKTNDDHIMPFWLRKKIPQPPTEIDPSAAIGGLHAIPFNLERETDITKEEIGCDADEEDPDEKSLG
jgi:hypothetical protein